MIITLQMTEPEEQFDRINCYSWDLTCMSCETDFHDFLVIMILWLTFSISGTVLEQYISLVTSKGKAWQRENLTYECVHWLMGSRMHTQLNSPSGRQQWGTAGRWSSLFLTASPGLHDPEHTQVSYLCVAALPLMQHKIKLMIISTPLVSDTKVDRWTVSLTL